MKSQIFLIIISLISGALIPVQASTNAAFSKAIGNPIITALMVFVVGLVGVFGYILIMRVPFPEIMQLKSAPAYGYLGGLIIAFYVIIITFVIPRIGVAPAIGLIVTGQIIAAILIDHFGWFDVAVRSLDLKRTIGMVCMILGVYLVMKK
jgi:bacterial/archaeal transporter family-2 protein